MNTGYRYLLQIPKFILEQAMKTQRGSRGKLYSFFNLGAIWRWRSAPLPGRFTPGQETGYIQSDIYWNVPTWTCATAHFSEHVSMRAARNVLTAIRVINWDELEAVKRQTDRVVVNLRTYSGSCPHATSRSAYQHCTDASGNLQLAGADRNWIYN